MLKKVVIFRTAWGDFCVMNVPENYRPSSTKPGPDSPDSYPRYFPDHADAVAEARARHGHTALVIDETH